MNIEKGLRPLVVVCLLLGGGCSSLQWAGLPPSEIQKGIHDGNLLEIGEQVGVVDRDGKEHVVRVEAVNEKTIVGKPNQGEKVELAIDDIVALRTHRRDNQRTAAASVFFSAVGSYGFLILLTALAAIR